MCDGEADDESVMLELRLTDTDAEGEGVCEEDLEPLVDAEGERPRDGLKRALRDNVGERLGVRETDKVGVREGRSDPDTLVHALRAPDFVTDLVARDERLCERLVEPDVQCEALLETEAETLTDAEVDGEFVEDGETVLDSEP